MIFCSSFLPYVRHLANRIFLYFYSGRVVSFWFLASSFTFIDKNFESHRQIFQNEMNDNSKKAEKTEYLVKFKWNEEEKTISFNSFFHFYFISFEISYCSHALSHSLSQCYSANFFHFSIILEYFSVFYSLQGFVFIVV